MNEYSSSRVLCSTENCDMTANVVLHNGSYDGEPPYCSHCMSKIEYEKRMYKLGNNFKKFRGYNSYKG